MYSAQRSVMITAFAYPARTTSESTTPAHARASISPSEAPVSIKTLGSFQKRCPCRALLHGPPAHEAVGGQEAVLAEEGQPLLNEDPEPHQVEEAEEAQDEEARPAIAGRLLAAHPVAPGRPHRRARGGFAPPRSPRRAAPPSRSVSVRRTRERLERSNLSATPLVRFVEPSRPRQACSRDALDVTSPLNH